MRFTSELRKSMNKPRTTQQIVKQVRAALIAKRLQVGANSQTGHYISTLIEQLENLPSYVRQTWATDERQTLPYMMKRSLERLAAAK